MIKMSKYVVALVLVTMLALTTRVQESNAWYAWSWSRTTNASGDYVMLETITMPSATSPVSNIKISIPNQGYNVYNAPISGDPSRVVITYKNDPDEASQSQTYIFTQCGTLSRDQLGDGCDEYIGDYENEYMPYEFDFVNIDSDFFGYYQTIESIQILLYQEYPGTPPDAVDQTEYFNDESVIDFEYGIAYEDKMNFSAYTLNGANYVVTDNEYLHEGIYFLNVYIPESPYHTDEGTVPVSGQSWQDGRAQIWFYEARDPDPPLPSFVIYLEEYLKDINVLGRIDGYISIDLVKIHADNDIDYNALDFGTGDQIWWQLVIPQSWDTVPDGYIDYLNAENFYTRNIDLAYVVYKVGAQTYATDIFKPDAGASPQNAVSDPTREGYIFTGWYLADGRKYIDWSSGIPYIQITDDLLYNNTLYLYAGWGKATAVDYGVDDPTPDGFIGGILATFNFNNTFGRLLVYIGSIVAVVLISVKRRWPLIVQMVIMMAITGVFLFLGFLPTLAAIVILMAMGLVLFTSMKGGGL